MNVKVKINHIVIIAEIILFTIYFATLLTPLSIDIVSHYNTRNYNFQYIYFYANVVYLFMKSFLAIVQMYSYPLKFQFFHLTINIYICINIQFLLIRHKKTSIFLHSKSQFCKQYKNNACFVVHSIILSFSISHTASYIHFLLTVYLYVRQGCEHHMHLVPWILRPVRLSFP